MIGALLNLALVALATASFPAYTTPNVGGAVGCVVTKNKLFSHGNYIRELHQPEVELLKRYKKDLASFKKKIDDAFENAEAVEAKNATIPPMPVRPTIPQFCNGKDTTLYIFGGCTIQNYKVYVGKTFARDLDAEERKRLENFITKMAAQKPGDNQPNLHKGLDFCTEF